MFRLVCAGGLVLGLLLAASARADEAQKQRKPNANPDQMFQKLDANGDGKLSKEEFAKMAERLAQKLGDKAKEFADRMFERLDANKDGFVSKEEASKLREQFQGQAGNKEEARKKIEELKQKFGNLDREQLKKKIEELRKQKQQENK